MCGQNQVILHLVYMAGNCVLLLLFCAVIDLGIYIFTAGIQSLAGFALLGQLVVESQLLYAAIVLCYHASAHECHLRYVNLHHIGGRPEVLSSKLRS